MQSIPIKPGRYIRRDDGTAVTVTVVQRGEVNCVDARGWGWTFELADFAAKYVRAGEG